MTKIISTPDRMPDEPEHAWHARVKKHIRKNAPKEHRYYSRGGKPGTGGDRWFVPGLFALLGLFFAISGFVMGADVRTLNGPNSAKGDFYVEQLYQGYTKRTEEPEFTPVVTVRNEQLVPLFSKPHENMYKIGDVVTLRYSTQGDVLAAFTKEDGSVSDGPSTTLTMIGLIIIVIGMAVAKYYKGAVEASYFEDEFTRITGKSGHPKEL